MTDVAMPRLSDSMEEGKILRWLKAPGEKVAVGEILAEVETDKADMELEAEAEGVLNEIRVSEGESVAVGAVIATLSSEGTESAPPATTPGSSSTTATGGTSEAAPTSAPPQRELLSMPSRLASVWGKS